MENGAWAVENGGTEYEEGIQNLSLLFQNWTFQGHKSSQVVVRVPSRQSRFFMRSECWHLRSTYMCVVVRQCTHSSFLKISPPTERFLQCSPPMPSCASSWRGSACPSQSSSCFQWTSPWHVLASADQVVLSEPTENLNTFFSENKKHGLWSTCTPARLSATCAAQFASPWPLYPPTWVPRPLSGEFIIQWNVSINYNCTCRSVLRRAGLLTPSSKGGLVRPLRPPSRWHFLVGFNYEVCTLVAPTPSTCNVLLSLFVFMLH